MFEECEQGEAVMVESLEGSCAREMQGGSLCPMHRFSPMQKACTDLICMQCSAARMRLTEIPPTPQMV